MHLFRDALAVLKGLRLTAVSYTRASPDLSVLDGKKLESLSAWGKYVFLHFGPGKLHLRIHWGMFGVYYLDEPRPGKTPLLQLSFTKGRELYFYAVSVRLIEGPLDTKTYDPHIDIMSPAFDVARAVQTMKDQPEARMICDVLMDQGIFAGLGNVIKNETLFARKIDPQSRMGSVPARAFRPLVNDVLEQAALFLAERQASGGYGHGWVQVYRKKSCPVCGGKVTREKTGAGLRTSHWCKDCQVMYPERK